MEQVLRSEMGRREEAERKLKHMLEELRKNEEREEKEKEKKTEGGNQRKLLSGSSSGYAHVTRVHTQE